MLEDLEEWMSVFNAADTVQKNIDSQMLRGKTEGKDKLRVAIRRAVQNEIGIAMVIYMGQVVCSIAIPVTAFLMLQWAEDQESPVWEGYVIVVGMTFANVLSVLLKEQFTARCNGPLISLVFMQPD